MRPALELALDVARAGLAADPPVPPPGALRRVLTFSRPSETAWETVRRAVERDDAFRARVVAVADAAEVGEASWLWLSQAEGWQDRLDALVTPATAAGEVGESGEVGALRRKLAGAEQAARRHEAEAERARSEAETARARLAEQETRLDDLAGQVADLRDALDEAATERRVAVRNLKAVEAELAQLRPRLRDAEDARRQAEAMVEALRAEAAASPAGQPTTEEPTVDAPAPEQQPAGPSVDLDTLRAAVRDAGSAAAALGAALDTAASALEPDAATQSGRSQAASPAEPPSGAWEASGRPRRSPRRRPRRPARLPGGLFEDTPEAAAHLLRLPDVIVVVDGYNVAKSAWTDVSLEEERRRLVQLLEGAHARTGAEFLVVFDGVGPHGAAPGQALSRTVRVRYSPAGVTADDVVRDLVDDLPLGRPVVVVSSDREVADGARARGANVVGSSQLLAAVR